MKKLHGFTLIEIIVFIVVISLMVNALFIAYSTSLSKMPHLSETIIARQTAKKCMEWFIGQRRLNGYNSLSCPSTSVPTFCTTPSGYNLSVNISCTTLNNDANYQTITVTVSGKGNAKQTTLIANY
jgi:type II secretory pathway pseudopilin PulG